MAISTAPETSTTYLCPQVAGITMTPEEFDHADFERGFRYELIRGVVVVSPMTSPFERGPNELLGYWLLDYQLRHSQGSQLDGTLSENDIFIGDQRRRADRVIWAGLGRMPRVEETPTIAIEFVSAGKRSLLRDYEDKRREYASVGVQEYWVVNRFDRTLTVYRGPTEVSVLKENDTYNPQLLPGFELRLIELFEAADRWEQSPRR
jgi:Uma2 family endonuclease